LLKWHRVVDDLSKQDDIMKATEAIIKAKVEKEIAEMVVDPNLDGNNPEVCDPCGPKLSMGLQGLLW
jgi:hypothetical protein